MFIYSFVFFIPMGSRIRRRLANRIMYAIAETSFTVPSVYRRIPQMFIKMPLSFRKKKT